MEVSPEKFPITPEVQRIGLAIQEAGGRPILVGGWVRDNLMGIPHAKDFDLEVFSLAPEKLEKILSRFGPVHMVGRHFGVLKLSTANAEYDVSVPRRETKTGKGHKDFRIEADPEMTFEEAAARRDFTINAIGYDHLSGELLDYFHGRRDLEQGRLRHVGPAFGEDPLRVLRAMQFAGRFRFEIAPETVAICREQELSDLPRERIWEEFKKLLLQAERPSFGLAYLEPLGLLPYFPELARLAALPGAGPSGDSPWGRTRAVVDQAAAARTGEDEPDMILMLGALCHRFAEAADPEAGAAPVVQVDAGVQQDGAAEATRPMESARGALPGKGSRCPAHPAEVPIRTFLERLTRKSGLADAVVDLVTDLDTPQRLHQIGGPESDGKIRRLALRVAIPFVLRLAHARHRAEEGGAESSAYPAGDWLAGRARELGVYDTPPEPILKGRHLLEMGLAPGPLMGDLLDRLFEKQLDGEVNTEEEALHWVRRETDPGPPATGGPS